MSKRKINQNSGNRISVSIPAYLRDKYDLKKGTTVDVTDDGNSIVITPIKEQ
ncbi:AbrB/MazE/SpoVT family DNA-binding domain-containing protein [Methanolobus vulcani]|uniref:AbrB/MazE/SpoVT family DNA-binding domain-containing protein n=1 Tax=Methanolobus vulcani TaxID=38026 RepID=A0A7Z8KSN1_9EURY|nr:AbrB/MazE/SpoVT family DNA-binding domain-containing protein [Methanolobus vulcani]TQD28270.1 AbrB/MazE/SpoVT family DNA-binding domain-containing protein [Methanolobus vulcani]